MSAQGTVQQLVTTSVRYLGIMSLAVLTTNCSGGPDSPAPAVQQTGTPGAQEAVGERLFLETRFAQVFLTYLAAGGDINDAHVGDPVVDGVETTRPGLPITPGPFQGLSMNCRACHLVDEVVSAPGGGMRAYADFARRSPIPARADGKTHAPRNSPPLVNATLSRPGGLLLHFDAEFNSIEDLVAGTFTGRNYGWLPGEQAQAIAHIAQVVRQDDGSGDIAQQLDGLPYRLLFTGANPDIPDEFRLPPEFRVQVGSATDQEIFDAVVRVVSAYVNGLRFSQRDEAGLPIRSPFDVWLEVNGLPQQPDPNETDLEYSRRLLQLVKARQAAGSLQFVSSNPYRPDGRFQFHDRPFVFGPDELAGLTMFLTEPSAIPPPPTELAAGKVGNCLACHPAPHFTDFTVHNTGTTQKEYDDIHGEGQFAALAIPDLPSRNAAYNQYLPATPMHPDALEPFRAIPTAQAVGHTDLGVWNVFANPDMTAPQAKLRALLCEADSPCATPDAVLLDRAIARFKTPGLRDLGHSAPYMHNGQFDSLESVLDFYRTSSATARAGSLRNAAPQLRAIALQESDIPSLTAFLHALNEDYQ